MEAYEDNLEKMNEHKKNVRDSTKATRDVYKSTDDKIRDYERESRRNVETDAPIMRKKADIVTETKSISTPSYNNYRSSSVIDTSYEEPKTESVRGNWRKDMAKFEENLSSKKSETKASSYTAATSTATETGYSWKKTTAASLSTTTTTTAKSTAASVTSSSTTSTKSYSSTASKSEDVEISTATSSWRDKFK